MFRVLAIVLVAYVVAYPRLANNSEPVTVERPLSGVREAGLRFFETLANGIAAYAPLGPAVAAAPAAPQR